MAMHCLTVSFCDTTWRSLNTYIVYGDWSIVKGYKLLAQDRGNAHHGFEMLVDQFQGIDAFLFHFQSHAFQFDLLTKETPNLTWYSPILMVMILQELPGSTDIQCIIYLEHINLVEGSRSELTYKEEITSSRIGSGKRADAPPFLIDCCAIPWTFLNLVLKYFPAFLKLLNYFFVFLNLLKVSSDIVSLFKSS